jgi:imidazolonepropionase-like amidohydrolase
MNGDKDAYITKVCDEILPAVAAENLADAVDGFCEGIAFSPEQIARVFDKAKELGLPVKLHADQLLQSAWRHARRRYGALSADHLEYTDEAGAIAMAKAGTVAVHAARRVLFHPRDQEAAGRSVPQARRADGCRDRLQSRHLAADLAAADHEHGGDAVPHDGR